MMKNLLIMCSMFLLTAAVPYIGETFTTAKTEYTVLNKLKEGSFSEVFEVQDQAGERHALKWYKNLDDPVSSGFFYLFGDVTREFIVGTTLDHSSIIKATDKWDRCLILELAKGKHLCKFKKNSLTYPQAVHVSLQLIDAMKHAFSHQYCNINLHEGDILLDENFSVKIVDLAFFFSFQELKKHFKIEGPDTELTFILVQHFNILTELCVQIFDKVSLSRAERIEKRLAIKKVIWELIEDFEEKIEIQLETKFDLLSETINL